MHQGVQPLKVDGILGLVGQVFDTQGRPNLRIEDTAWAGTCARLGNFMKDWQWIMFTILVNIQHSVKCTVEALGLYSNVLETYSTHIPPTCSSQVIHQFYDNNALGFSLFFPPHAPVLFEVGNPDNSALLKTIYSYKCPPCQQIPNFGRY